MGERFARHDLIPGWSQQRLAAATVAVVGVGALGNEVARLLAMAGVGRLLLCDPDRVEESNLSRTALFRAADVGRLKVEAATRALAELAPGTAVEARPAPLVHGIGLAELRDASLVAGCLDSRSARLQLAGRASLVRTPLVDGGTHPWGGEVRPYLDPDGACYACSLTAEERGVADAPWSCLDVVPAAAVGAAAPSSALIGSWMALVATRFLMGLSAPAGTVSVDGPRGTARIVAAERDPECPFHVPVGAARRLELTAGARLAELRRALGDGATPLVWEPVERRSECLRCGWHEERWRLPVAEACPRCGAAATPRTTLELDEAPGELTLADLGVAPREILAVRGDGGLSWVELS